MKPTVFCPNWIRTMKLVVFAIARMCICVCECARVILHGKLKVEFWMQWPLHLWKSCVATEMIVMQFRRTNRRDHEKWRRHSHRSKRSCRCAHLAELKSEQIISIRVTPACSWTVNVSCARIWLTSICIWTEQNHKKRKNAQSYWDSVHMRVAAYYYSLLEINNEHQKKRYRDGDRGRCRCSTTQATIVIFFVFNSFSLVLDCMSITVTATLLLLFSLLWPYAIA